MECTALLDLLDWLDANGSGDEPDRCPDTACALCVPAAPERPAVLAGTAA